MGSSWANSLSNLPSYVGNHLEGIKTGKGIVVFDTVFGMKTALKNNTMFDDRDIFELKIDPSKVSRWF